MQSDISTAGQASATLTAVPLFHAAWLFAVGIVFARWPWLRPSLLLLGAASAAILCGIAAFRAQRIAWFPMSLLWLLLGAWCALMEPHPAPSPALAAFSDDLLRTVDGVVIDSGPVRVETEENLDEPSIATRSQRIDLRVASVELITDTVDQQVPVTGGVRLTIRWPTDATQTRPFDCGEHIRAVVRLLPPETYRDPGVWSRADYLSDQGITSTASVTIDRVDRLGRVPGPLLACRVRSWQHASTARLLALPATMRGLLPWLRLTPDDAAMLAAMIAGDRTYLNQRLRVGFERTGSFHMLVVSGFHLAIVAGGIFWIIRGLRLARGPATLLTIFASLAYALFTGFAVPVQRSFWMITLYLLGRLIYRERSPLNTIGFAALCMLALSPRSLFGASLQMTLLAVVAIAGIAMPLLEATIHPYARATHDLRIIALDAKIAPRIAQFRVALRMVAFRLQAILSRRVAWRVFPWMVRSLIRLVELVVVSFVIELAMTLPMAVYFHRVTLFALPVNLLILPLLAVLIPAALLLLLALAIWPATAMLPAMVLALGLHLGVRVVGLFGSLALGDLRIPSPLVWQSAAFCGLLAASVALAHWSVCRGGWKPVCFGAVALLLAGFLVIAPRPVQRPKDALLVEAIDVGQGDSLLLITPDGKSLLVDGGGFGGGPRQAPQQFDIGEEVVSPTLWSRGIRHLDAVVLTHAHSDHMGGLPAILRNFRPRELWVGHNPPTAAYEALLAEAAMLHVHVRTLHAGEGFPFGQTDVRVLAPLANYRLGPEPSNNDSLVLHVAYGQSSVLLEGDAEAPIEQDMLSEPDLASTLLKVGHHGSITSTRPEFLARVAPRWAVISCGLHNRYGHPRQEVLAELQAAHVRTLRTDINGIACFRLDGRSIKPDFACTEEMNLK